MKLPLLASLVALLLSSVASATEWATLTKIGDTLEVPEGATALIVGTAKPSYLLIKESPFERLGMRIRPYRRGVYGISPRRADYPSEVEVDWNRPFPVAGPCTIRLGTNSVTTFRILNASRPRR